MFRLAKYDPLAKRRAIIQDLGEGRWEPVAWVDYDDVSKQEADQIAAAMLEGLRRAETHEAAPPLRVALAVPGTPGVWSRHEVSLDSDTTERLLEELELDGFTPPFELRFFYTGDAHSAFGESA